MFNISNESLPCEFNESLISAIESEPSREMDEKILSIVVDKNLIKSFGDWVARNSQWGINHSMLVHDIVMISVSQGIIKNIGQIEAIASDVWSQDIKNLTQSLDRQGTDENLKRLLQDAIKNKNKLLIYLILFKYLITYPRNKIDFLKISLQELSEDELLNFLNLVDNDGWSLTMLHHCARKHQPELLEAIFNSISTFTKRHLIFNSLHNVLYYAISSGGSLATIKNIVKFFPKSERCGVVEKLIKEKGLLFMSANPQAINTLVSAVPKMDRSRILQNDEGRLLPFVLDHHWDDLFIKLVSSLPVETLRETLELGPDGMPILHRVVASRRNNIIDFLLNLLSPSDQMYLVKLCNAKGQSILHYAAQSGSEELIVALMSPFTEKSESISLVRSVDNEGRTPLHKAAQGTNATALKVLLPALSPKEIEDIVSQIDAHGHDVLQYAVKAGNPNFNKVLLDALPQIYQTKIAERLTALMEEIPSNSEVMKGIVNVIPYPLYSHLLPKFQIRQRRLETNSIFLYGKSEEFLIEKRKLITEYTSKIDPGIELREKYQIKQVKNPKDLERGFTHYMAVHRILPRPVRVLYGSQPYSKRHNCHGAALLAAGICPKFQCLETPYAFDQTTKRTHEISIKHISVGDLVYLQQGPKGTRFEGVLGSHSFVFLSNDFCLSMNGSGKKMEFYSTADVLSTYGYPKEALKIAALEGKEDHQKEWIQHIKVLRKNPDWTWPEESMSYS